MSKKIYIGCAGWAIPASSAESFPREGSHLERYAARFNAVEINSTFYRSHRAATYERWASCVPAAFRFCVKMPRSVTHDARLKGSSAQLAEFIDAAKHLGTKLGCILVQLPPSLVFEPGVADRFLKTLRTHYDGPAVLEARHPSWFVTGAKRRLAEHRVTIVTADPQIDAANLRKAALDEAREPDPTAVDYFRYHGSPRIYYSAYSEVALEALARKTNAADRTVWCIFDNTALGAATDNALRLKTFIPRASKFGSDA